MHRMHLLIAAVVAGGIALTSLARPAPASAVVEYHFRLPFTDEFDSCTGERVLVSGTAHAVGTVTEDSAGGLHFANARMLQGHGVGLASGARYVLVSPQTTGGTSGATTGGATTFTLRWTSLLLRQGNALPGDDAMAHLVVHLTLNANGEMTASIITLRAVCK